MSLLSLALLAFPLPRSLRAAAPTCLSIAPRRPGPPHPHPHPHPNTPLPPPSELCSYLDIDGVRGDITINRAVLAFAALEGRPAVSKEDLERVAPIVLNHR